MNKGMYDDTLELQRIRDFRHKGLMGEKTNIALTDFKVANFKTNPMRLELKSIVCCVCVSPSMESVLNGYVDWIEEGKLTEG